MRPALLILTAVSCASTVGFNSIAHAQNQNPTAAPALSGPKASAPVDSVDFVDERSKPRVFRVRANVSISGSLQTPKGEPGQVTSLQMSSQVDFDFKERKIDGAGRGPESLRTLRHYTKAQSRTLVADRKSTSRLPPDRRLLVAQGTTTGSTHYSMSAQLERPDIDLLDMPGDTMAVNAMLPNNSVEKREKWNPNIWVIQMLTGVEAVKDSNLVCELQSFTRYTARVRFEGEITGATLGAATRVNVNGHFVWNRRSQAVEHFEMEQHEKRSVGTVSPGLDVVAKVSWDRTPLRSGEVPLTDELAESVPIELEEQQQQLIFTAPGKATFRHGRNWHLFHRTPQMSVLRLVENGSLVAQVNVSEVNPKPAGQHTSEERFQSDIRQALGSRLREIAHAEAVETDDSRFIYRVTAKGNSADQAMTWYYYLCAAPSGRQVAFVFSVSDADIEKLDERDLGMVRSIAFSEPSVASKDN